MGVVPFVERALVPADPQRHQLFRETLRAALAEAVLLAVEPAAPESPADPDLQRALGWGCAMCTGRCCHGGGVHAFLSPEELALKLAQSRLRSHEDLFADYVAATPRAHSMEGVLRLPR